MSSTIHEIETAQQVRLKERIRQYKAEVTRLRDELGDPEEALNRFVIEHFDLEAMLPDDRDSQGSISATWEDDADAG